MSRNAMSWMLVCTVCLLTTAQGASIVWVDEGAADSFPTWQALLEGAGHTVTQMSDMGTLDQAKIDALNAADLVIVSRDTDSGNYDDGDEVDQWNAITAPMIQCSVYLIRSSRWRWVDDTGVPGMTDNMQIVENHPIFKGVGQAGGQLAMVTTTTNISGATDAGNGQVLATHADGRIWIATWEEGVEFYAGSGQVASAPRMFFAAGLNENSADKGNMNLTEDGQKIFLNAVAFMTGEAAGVASGPIPEDTVVDVLRDTVLTWVPNEYEGTHNLYFGDNFDDVNTMTVPTVSALDVNVYDPGRLEFGKTYYWRVDEVNASPDKTVFKGNVWSFSVEPYAILVPVGPNHVNASSSVDVNPPSLVVDGSGFDGTTHGSDSEAMWLSATGDTSPRLTFEFDDLQKLDRMVIWNSNTPSEGFIGWGIKNVNIETSVDGAVWTALADAPQIDQAPGLDAYDTPQTVDLGLAVAKYVRLNILSNWGGLLQQYGLSEVQFYGLPVYAREPNPASGSTGILPQSIVTWRAGREAAQHRVYLDAQESAVTDGSAPSVTSTNNSVGLGSLNLELSSTYYWKVDEVNDGVSPSVWSGPVWTLSTASYLTVDDFEGYNNQSPTRPFQTWLDGYGYSADDFFPTAYAGNGTGSGIGHDIWSPSSPYFGGSIMETDITIAGSNQSMPFYYSNTGGVASETQRTFEMPQDWTVGEAQTLSIAFHGQTGNTGTLFAKIDNAKVTYQRDNGNLSRSAWQVWNIDLSTVNSTLSSVSTLTLGVEGAGATGMILFDDIRLYAEPGEIITPTDPGMDNLAGAWSFDEGSGTMAMDSSGHGRNGTLIDAAWVDGIQGTALSFNGTSAYVNIDGFKGINAVDGVQQPFTISNWIKTVTDGEMVTWGLQAAATRLSWRVEGGVLRTEHAAGNLRSDTPVNDDEWHHVALVVTEGAALQVPQTQFYLDGLPDTTNSGTDTPYNLTPDFDVRIGMSGPLGDRFFNGLIDEVRLYDRVLTDEELLWLAGRSEPIDKPF